MNDLLRHVTSPNSNNMLGGGNTEDNSPLKLLGRYVLTVLLVGSQFRYMY